MTATSIQWTDISWNPVRGCSRVSAGCGDNSGGGCYAERQAHRFSGPGGPYEGLTRQTANGPRWTGKIRLVPELLDQPLKWRKPRRVFVNSMSDLFHEDVPDEFIDRVFVIMNLAERHTFQVLTKRADRMRAYAVAPDRRYRLAKAWLALCAEAANDDPLRGPARCDDDRAPLWPLPNVHLGVSVENQETADERIPLLLETPAAVRFVSYEPALGPVDFSRFLPVVVNCTSLNRTEPETAQALKELGRAAVKHAGWATLDWVIVGGESGPGARPCDVAWIRSIVEQCRAAGVACFVKQLGALPVDHAAIERVPGGRVIPAGDDLTDEDLRVLGEMIEAGTVRLRDRKGGSMEEWPEDLRVREFPS